MRSAFGIFVLLLLTACTKPEETSDASTYFDLKVYFEKEAIKLQKQNPMLTKMVQQNGESETKYVRIADWKSELGFFIASDINKPAWRNSYQVIKKPNQITYLAQDDGLRTRKIEIYNNQQGGVKQISIFNKTTNILYTSTEAITYFPDSLFEGCLLLKLYFVAQMKRKLQGASLRLL